LTLVWEDSSDVVYYEFCYDTSDDNNCEPWVSTGAISNVNISGLSYSTTYYWQVRAVNTYGPTYANGGSDNYWNFTTHVAGEPPGAFNKLSPTDEAVNQSVNLTLNWGDSTGADYYEYCYDMTNDKNCSEWVSTGSTSNIKISGLSLNTTYYWQVRSVNNFGTTYANDIISNYWSFTTYKVKIFLPFVASGF
jgi:predicted phage tail protein